MSSAAAVKSPARENPRLHPLAVRIFHWLNALATIVMILSGWKIYNDEVLFGWLHFPEWATIGGAAQGALQWHFAAMWLLALNGLAYLGYGLASGRFRAKLWPIRPAAVVADIRAALAFRLAHDDITIYNSVQKLLYVGVIALLSLQVLTGLSIWKPIQLSELAALFGEFQTARLLHFLGMAGLVLFLVVHVALALAVPATLKAMLTGGPRVPARRARSEPHA